MWIGAPSAGEPTVIDLRLRALESNRLCRLGRDDAGCWNPSGWQQRGSRKTARNTTAAGCSGNCIARGIFAQQMRRAKHFF
jgi:hypothetical protein